MKVTVDFRGLEIADDEQTATSHYGGIILIKSGEDCESVYPHGTDRDDGYWSDLRETLETEFGLNFEQIEQEYQGYLDDPDNLDFDEDRFFNLMHLDNYGNVVVIEADENGVVIKDPYEDPRVALSDRLSEMIQVELSKMLNSPGTWFAYDPKDDFEFSFKWNDGKTQIFIDEEEFVFKINVVEA